MSDENQNQPANETEKALKGRETKPKVKPAPAPKEKPVETPPEQQRDFVDETLSIFGWGND